MTNNLISSSFSACNQKGVAALQSAEGGRLTITDRRDHSLAALSGAY